MQVFITGGTSGIGLALARRYVDAGHRVAAYALAAAPDAERLSYYPGDVRDAAALQAAVAEFSGSARLDLMIACAGINHGHVPHDWPDFDRERQIVAVNVLGVLNAFDAGLTVMRRQRAGGLVAIASASGFFGVPGHAAYSASKAAVITLCEAYATDLRRHGIRVTCAAPGFVATPLTHGNPDPMPGLLSADEAARRIIAAVATGRELIVFPRQIALLAGLLRQMPRSMYRALFRAAHRRRMARVLPVNDSRGSP